MVCQHCLQKGCKDSGGKASNDLTDKIKAAEISGATLKALAKCDLVAMGFSTEEANKVIEMANPTIKIGEGAEVVDLCDGEDGDLVEACRRSTTGEDDVIRNQERKLSLQEERERSARNGASSSGEARPPILTESNGSGNGSCLLYTSPSPRDKRQSRMPSSA